MNTLVLNRLENKLHKGIQFSVIIPAHNAEKTLRRAVESVLAAMETVSADAVIASRSAAAEEGRVSEGEEQSGKNAPLFEVLIIENGSEDATEFIGRSLQAEHEGFVRLLKSDKGVSNARNMGLENAGGQRILFLDADDFFTEDAGEVLRDSLHFTGTDLIICSYEAGGRQMHICPPQGERFTGPALEDISVCMIENPTRYTSVWSKIFRRDCIERLHLRFDPSLRLSEDSFFIIQYLAGCRRIRLLDRFFYHYSTDGGSVVRTWDGSKEEGYKQSLGAVLKYLQTQPQRIRDAGAGYAMMQFNLLMVREVFSLSSPLSISEKIRTMKRIAAEEPFASAIDRFDPDCHKGARYLPFRMLRYRQTAAAAAIYAARAVQNARREGE